MDRHGKPRLHHPAWLIAGFWLCVIVAIAAVLRRLFAFVHPAQGGPPQVASLDSQFSSHAVLTLLHIIPAAVFVLLSASILLRQAKSVWMERLFFLFGAITGVTAYAMNSYAVGGWVEQSAVLVFNTWFLASLSRAYYFHSREEPMRQRRWMTRAVGVLLGIATTRPVMGVFFATSRLTHLQFTQFFGIAFWIGFSINTIAIELWLHSKRRTQLYAPERLFAISLLTVLVN